MRNTINFLLVITAMTINMAWAQQESDNNSDPAAPPPIPPIPPKVQGEEIEPSVVITEREGERIEEYSQDGRVYMVKITPVKGPAYYYMDEDGDGQLELSESDRARHGPVRPVFWKVKEW
ncbi:MAG: DUF2782 domain-containing protein [Xanthomonadales bacterium]|nr:DUF2782 domain-containing protein [Xanthomonadales bacterium]